MRDRAAKGRYDHAGEKNSQAKVRRNGNSWQAIISIDRKTVVLGSAFRSPEVAHEAYRRAATERYGEAARFNCKQALATTPGCDAGQICSALIEETKERIPCRHLPLFLSAVAVS
jgi:hypothetical protein